jgi:hypothetical protein
VNSKQKAQRVHAKRRAKSRYGLDFTKEVRRTFTQKIHNNKAKFLYGQSRRVSIFEIVHDDKTYKVVYDKLRGEIVTFLPSEDIGHEVPSQ